MTITLDKNEPHAARSRESLMPFLEGLMQRGSEHQQRVLFYVNARDCEHSLFFCLYYFTSFNPLTVYTKEQIVSLRNGWRTFSHRDFYRQEVLGKSKKNRAKDPCIFVPRIDRSTDIRWLRNLLNKTKPKYLIIDSAQAVLVSSIELERLMNRHPETSFILICRAKKCSAQVRSTVLRDLFDYRITLLQRGRTGNILIKHKPKTNQ